MFHALERLAVRLVGIVVAICLVLAILNMGGCGMVSGLCQDIAGASDAIAGNAHATKVAKDKAAKNE